MEEDAGCEDGSCDATNGGTDGGSAAASTCQGGVDYTGVREKQEVAPVDGRTRARVSDCGLDRARLEIVDDRFVAPPGADDGSPGGVTKTGTGESS